MSQKRIKLPKRIAGVKIPKVVRKGPVADFLNSSGGQVLLAEALMLAGGVFAAKEADGTRVSAASASSRLAHACGEAVRAFRAALADESHVPAAHDAVASELDAAGPGVIEEMEDIPDAGPKKKRGARHREDELPHAPAR